MRLLLSFAQLVVLPSQGRRLNRHRIGHNAHLFHGVGVRVVICVSYDLDLFVELVGERVINDDRVASWLGKSGENIKVLSILRL